MTQTALTPDQFRERIRATEVKCKICGFSAHSLTKHISEAHGLTAGQYQKKFPKAQHPDVRLLSPIISELMKNINRSSQTTADFEDFLPTYEGSQGFLKGILQMCAKAPRGTMGEGLTLPDADPDYWWDEKNAVALGAALAAGMNAYLVGPTGSGKTEIVYQMHALIGKPMIRINMNGDATRAALIGEMRADPVKGTYFQEGALPIAMRAGATLLVDEVDYAPAHVLACLNPVLEGKRTLFIEETGQTLKGAAGFQIFGTANTGGKGDSNGNYTGTEILNTAFLDRFPIVIKADYLPADPEQNMLKKRFPNAAPDVVKKLVKFAGEMREAFKKGNLSLTLSTRKNIEILRLEQMVGMERAVELALTGWLDDDDAEVVKAMKKRAQL